MKYLVVAIVLFGFVSCQKDKKEYREIEKKIIEYQEHLILIQRLNQY